MMNPEIEKALTELLLLLIEDAKITTSPEMVSAITELAKIMKY
ncbi:hypothetical protein ABTQ33_07695 [Paucilactobacillus suebicus]|nr:hypothetical protein [Paucilactobacillus suebicus]